MMCLTWDENQRLDVMDDFYLEVRSGWRYHDPDLDGDVMKQHVTKDEENAVSDEDGIRNDLLDEMMLNKNEDEESRVDDRSKVEGNAMKGGGGRKELPQGRSFVLACCGQPSS